MSLSIPKFWKLLIESRLLTTEDCQRLGVDYDGTKRSTDVRSLAKWLIAQNALTKYQAQVLLAGRPGPFHYGEYKVYDRQQQGILGRVFRAIHEPTGYPVLLHFASGDAIKELPRWADFARQIHTDCVVVHPNVRRCFEAVDLTAFKFVVSEDLGGESLDRRLAAGKKLRAMDACRVIRSASLGLAAIHQAGLVHGDVRLQNVWVESGGHIKLVRDPLYRSAPLDLAKVDLSSDLAARADYLAPELAQSGKTHDALTDIYALGCTFYQLLTGRPPFEGGDVMQKLQRHAKEPIQPLEQLGVSSQVAQMVADMMAKNPAARYQQAIDVADQLVPLIDPAQLHVRPPAPLPTLVAYEGWIRQKQSAMLPPPLAEPPCTDAPVAFPQIGAPSGSGPLTAMINVVERSAVTGTGSSTVTSRYRPKRGFKKNLLMVSAGVGAAALFGLVLLIVMSSTTAGPSVASNGSDERKGDDEEVAATDGSDHRVDVSPSAADAAGAESHYRNIIAIADDGKSLWVPPTNGPPISASYVPSAVRVLIVARPKQMLASRDGQLALEALGPKFTALRVSWEKAVGLSLGEIEQLTIGLHDNDGKRPRPSFVVRPAGSVTEADLVRRWGNPSTKAIPQTSVEIYTTPAGWSFFMPPPDPASGGNVAVFIMGSEADLIDSIKKGRAPPVLRREIEQLLDSSDDARHVTMVFAPNFLLNDEGQQLFADQLQKVVKPLAWLLGDGLQAGMLSMHLDGQLYLELRFKSQAGIHHVELADAFRGRLEQIPMNLEAYIDSLNPPPYWRPLARRFPLQIHFLHRHTRVGAEDDQAVINAVLPSFAAPSLLAASELMLASEPERIHQATAAVGSRQTPQSIEELLAVTYDIQILSEDMINVMKVIQEELSNTYGNLPFRLVIKILGSDLQLEGITQNQRVNDFQMSGKSFAEVLTGIVRKANPVTTVKDPSEVDQKLIWVVGPDPTTGEKAILITTRKAAEQRKYELPKPFRPKSA